MLWKFLVSCIAFLTKAFYGPSVNEPPYEATPFGPQSWREAHIAMQALQGESGDMRFPEDWSESAGIKDEKFRWPGYPGNGTIPFEIDSSAIELKPLIKAAMKQYHKNTCIRFVPRTDEENYVLISRKAGCYSYVGRVGGAQVLSLGWGCDYIGTCVHELGHAVGMHHEHQRSDRDRYLHVYPKNVVPGQVHNFQMTPTDKELKWFTYDYTSIMHYGNYAFSRGPGSLMTMEAKDGTRLKEPYEQKGLNPQDIKLVNKLYKCKGHGH